MKSNVLIGLGLGAFLFSPSTSHAQKAKEAKTPNVIFIYADDLGYGDLECYGATRVQTPNVNQHTCNSSHQYPIPLFPAYRRICLAQTRYGHRCR